MTEQMNVPKLRFSEFEGEWKPIQSGVLFPKIRNGFVGTATPYYSNQDEGIKYLQGKNVKNNAINETGLIYVNQQFHAKNAKSQLQEDDVVMVQSGHVGECARITKELVNTNCHALLVASPNKAVVNSDFAVYYYYSPLGKALIHKITTGNTIKHILGSDLKELNIGTPTLPEQQKLASFLSKVDEKIGLLTEKKDKLTEYKKGVMQQLFNGKFGYVDGEENGQLTFIPPTLRFKADDGSEFADWEEKTLGDYYQNLSTGMTPSRKVVEYFSGENLWITSGELNYGLVKDSKEKITQKAIKDTSLKIYPAGTFFIAITGLEAPGTRGRCAINAIPATTNQSCMAFVELESIDTNFLSYWYKYHSEALYCKYAQGTKQQSFNNKLIERIPIVLPSKTEQTKIANFLSAIDQKIDLANSELDKAKEWKKGLLQQMFV
ncbi:restriction endonuclease subunit S [Vibrio breoganii]